MSTQAYKRLNKEFKQIQANPPPFIIARPSEDNILDWHYIITGPPGTPYENGQYHGRITFPSEYPFKPPRIKMCTPSGRFEINQRLCLSMSDFHEESWNPSWSVATIITGLLSFMTGDERTTGSIVTSTQTKIQLAKKSKEFNTYSNPPFKKVFRDIWEQNLIDLKQMEEDEKNKASSRIIPEQPVKKEKIVENIEEIEDPEDKIRAQLINNSEATDDSKNVAKNNNNGKFNINSFYLVTLVIIIGIIAKNIGFF